MPGVQGHVQLLSLPARRAAAAGPLSHRGLNRAGTPRSPPPMGSLARRFRRDPSSGVHPHADRWLLTLCESMAEDFLSSTEKRSGGSLKPSPRGRETLVLASSGLMAVS